MNEISLSDIAFPVYVIGEKNPITEEKVTFFLFTKNEEYHTVVVDDKNIPQSSLAMRRLTLASKNIKLHPLKKAIFFLGDLIKIAKSTTWFIDSNGQLLNYVKKKKVNLEYLPITNIKPIGTGGSMIEVKSIPSRFKTLLDVTKTFRVKPTHAGILRLGMSNILYGLYDQEYKDTKRWI